VITIIHGIVLDGGTTHDSVITEIVGIEDLSLL